VPRAADPKAVVCLILDWMTAFQMLKYSARATSGLRLFIHGVSGACGLALAQLGKNLSCELYGTASPAKHALLAPLQVSCFDSSNNRFVDEVKALGGVDVVFDALGYESFDRSYAMLRRGGVLVGYGFNGHVFGSAPGDVALSFMKLYARNLIPDGKRTAFFGIQNHKQQFAPDFQELLGQLVAGRITPTIKAVFPLAELQAAHRAWEKGDGMGSIVIAVGRG